MLSKLTVLSTYYPYTIFLRRVEFYISTSSYQLLPSDCDDGHYLYRFLYKHNRELLTEEPYSRDPIFFESGAQLIYADSEVTPDQKVTSRMYILKADNHKISCGLDQITVPKISEVFQRLDENLPIYIHNKISIIVVNPIVIMKYSTYVI